MLKRVAFLGAIAALTLASPSHSLAQDWGGGGWGGGVTVHVGFPFHRRSELCCEERRFFPRRRVFCCEDERRFFPRRRVFCCEDERQFFPRRRVFCCEDERQFFPRRRVFCCEDERQFFPRRFRRDDNWNAGYTDAGYGYDEY
jgi:hypothetical protein